MINKSIIVCGCTKNSSSYIKKNLLKLLNLKDIFKNFHMVIYENDSTDNTVNELESFKQDSNSGSSSSSSSNSLFNYITENNVKYNNLVKNGSRTRPLVIAHARNKLLEYVNNHYSHYDYMMMVDLDDILNNFTTHQIEKLFNNTNNNINITNCDAIFANCLGKYYDIWALRINKDIWDDNIHGKIWDNPIDYDCWEEVDKFLIEINNIIANSSTPINKKSIIDAVQKKRFEYIYNNQRIIDTSNPLIPVTSAFGGIGIYKISKIKNCRYNPVTIKDDNQESHSNKKKQIINCEHISFHNDMINKNNAKLFIHPAFLVTQASEHVL